MDFLWKLVRWNFLLWKWRRENGTDRTSDGSPEMVSPDLPAIHNPDSGVIQLTWVGHSTFLIQVGGLSILTDPVWSSRASPHSFLGPKRIVPPGLAFEDLPRIDAVLVSHSHYDHLDLPTLRRLGHEPTYFVMKHCGAWFRKRGFQNVIELSWWHSHTLKNSTIRAVPAKHWSRRSFPDHDHHGWGGWIIESPRGRIYFAGDTAYDDTFSEIGRRFGPMELSLIPIGAYEPRDLMRWAHIDPEEAVKIHTDVRSKRSIAMHWGTFRLSAEDVLAPPKDLQRAVHKAGLPPQTFEVMNIGETRRV